MHKTKVTVPLSEDLFYMPPRVRQLWEEKFGTKQTVEIEVESEQSPEEQRLIYAEMFEEI